MTEAQIKILLDKYFAGETSLEEEDILSTYFNGANIAASLKEYQPLFQFLKAEKHITLSESTTYAIENISKKPFSSSTLRGGYWWKAAAAILILGIGSFILIDKLYKPNTQILVENHRIKIYDEHDDPEKALAEVQAALKLVSKKMKKGNDEAIHGLEKVKKGAKELDKILPNEESEK